MFVLLFGRQGYLGPWLIEHDYKGFLAVPGIVLATIFVSFPFVAREIIPVSEASGIKGGEAARVLAPAGCNVLPCPLPNIKWGLLYGVILCNDRAMGSFSPCRSSPVIFAVETNTLPLHVRFCTTNTTSRRRLLLPRCSRFWRWSHWC